MSNEGGTADDPKKYIIERHDFRRIPRWDNDGIHKHREENKNNSEMQSATEDEMRSATPLQRELSDLLGCTWMCRTERGYPPDSYDMADAFLQSLPWSIQKDQATKDQDLDAAQSHLLKHRKDERVKEILKDIGYAKAIYRASKDQRRFPQWQSLLAPLLQRNWGSDNHLNLLFGNVAYIRGVLFEVGNIIASPPPYGSPAYAIWNPILHQEGKARVKPACGMCGVEESPTQRLMACNSCKSIKYCSKECQKKDWPVHKPDCLEKQGKEVPESVRQKADAVLAKWKAAKEREKQDKETQYFANLKNMWESFCSEDASLPYSYDCYGNRFALDLPVEGQNIIRLVAGDLANLKVENDLEIGIWPNGFPHDMSCRGLGLLCSVHETGAKILILYERLFANEGNGPFTGLCLMGIWVVDREVMEINGRSRSRTAVWKEVLFNRLEYREMNRCQRIVKHLEKAKAEPSPCQRKSTWVSMMYPSI